MKIYKKIILILLVFMIVFSIIPNTSLFAYTLYSPKIYYLHKVNDLFDCESVIVILDKNISERNKKQTKIFDKLHNVLELIDLTSGEQFNDESFEQIIKVKLTTNTRRDVLKTIKQLEKIPGIKYVGPNKYVDITQSSNDTYYTDNKAWHIDMLDISNVWDYTTGNNKVRVGVIDSGIASHEDLIMNIEEGYDCHMTNEITDDDVRGHGTFVSGIIGAAGNNGKGTVGINWDISLVPLQVSDRDGLVDSAACVTAVNYATQSYNTNNPIRIINFSICDYDEWPELESAIRNYPGLFVCAAGNEGKDTDIIYSYPGYYGSNLYSNPLDNIIVVGAIDQDYNRSQWSANSSSNFGANSVDIYAFGSNIISTFPINRWFDDDFYVEVSEGYLLGGGTSFAAPQVTGILALLLSLDDDLTNAQLKSAILNSASSSRISVPKFVDSNTVDGTKWQNILIINAYDSMKYIFSNYLNTYNLSNQVTTVTYDDFIDPNSDYLFEQISYSCLNVLEEKNYDFYVSSSEDIIVKLYDQQLNLISIENLNSMNNIVAFNKQLAAGKYFMSIEYENINSIGEVFVEIRCNDTPILVLGNNNILINYLDDKTFEFVNNYSTGLYTISLNVLLNVDNIYYPNNSIIIYDNEYKTNPMNRLTTSSYELDAITSANSNNLVVYLQQGETYYIDVSLPYNNISSLRLNIELIDDEYIIDVSEESSFDVMTDETQLGDNFVKLDIVYQSVFYIDYDYNGIQEETIYFVLYKEVYNTETQKYELQLVLPELLVTNGESFVWSSVLSSGTYYIGYYNKLNSLSTISINIVS